MRILVRLCRQLQRRRPAPALRADWSTSFTPRDWADLPAWHPRGDDHRR